MTHTYELRSWNNDGNMTIVLKLAAEPKHAKEKAKEYAKQHPGLYSLEEIDKVAMYLTEKE